MSFGTQYDEERQADLVLNFEHSSGATFILVKNAGAISKPLNPPPDITQVDLTVGEVESLFQDFMDLVNGSADFTCSGGVKNYLAHKEITP